MGVYLGPSWEEFQVGNDALLKMVEQTYASSDLTTSSR